MRTCASLPFKSRPSDGTFPTRKTDPSVTRIRSPVFVAVQTEVAAEIRDSLHFLGAKTSRTLAIVSPRYEKVDLAHVRSTQSGHLRAEMLVKGMNSFLLLANSLRLYCTFPMPFPLGGSKSPEVHGKSKRAGSNPGPATMNEICVLVIMTFLAVTSPLDLGRTTSSSKWALLSGSGRRIRHSDPHRWQLVKCKIG